MCFVNAKRFSNMWSDIGWVEALENNVNVVVSPISSNGVKFVEEVKDVVGRDDAVRMDLVEAFDTVLRSTIWVDLKVKFVMVKSFKTIGKKENCHLRCGCCWQWREAEIGNELLAF